MIFIIGGSGEDKLKFCEKRFNLDYNVYDWEKNIDEYNLIGDLKTYLEKYNNTAFSKFEIIIADEIGYGIVPMDKKEREFRDYYGGICCKIAENADIVIRVICGIGQVLKGDLK